MSGTWTTAPCASSQATTAPPSAPFPPVTTTLRPCMAQTYTARIAGFHRRARFQVDAGAVQRVEAGMGAQWKHAGRQASATAKGRVFSKLAKEIALAAKAGADPAGNARLRAAIEAAKKHSMPRDTLDRAIKKGAGLLDEQVNYELVTYEGFT